MRCSRCEKNNANFTVEYDTDFGKVKEFFCKDCYENHVLKQKSQKIERGFSDYRCSFCGNAMEDYLHSGLVGCGECYAVFAQELLPFVIRLQGNVEHRGKKRSKDPKYEAAQSLRELLTKREKALKVGDKALASRLQRNVDELKLLLFGDEEDEGV